MKRIICFVTTALVVAMILAPSAALAQDEDTMMPERNVVEVGSVEEITGGQPLPKSGGPEVPGASVLLPAAALLLGSGVLVYGVLRRGG